MSTTAPDGEEAPRRMLEAADRVLPAPTADLLRRLHAFTDRRMQAAGAAAESLTGQPRSPEAALALHAFLRESWEVLDGLGRQVNAVMQLLHPEAGLYPPLDMTRQCTFYTVRKRLHEHPATAEGPVARLLWRSTRGEPAAAYRRLSLLYNASLFLPLDPVDGRLPGWDDLPAPVRRMVRPQPVASCGMGEGTSDILRWLGDMRRECCARLEEALCRRGDVESPTDGAR